MNSSIIRIGVLGVGFGAQVHIPAFQSFPGVAVVSVCAAHTDHAAKIASKFHIRSFHSTLEDFFKEDFDAVSIALPPNQNEHAIRMALKRRIPILAEKPFAASAQSASELAKLAKDTITMVDFQFPELEVFQALRELIEKKKYGNVRHASALWCVESFVEREKKWSWKTDARRGGGVISLLGSHLLFLVEWMLGDIQRIAARVDSAATKTFTPPGEIAAEDYVAMSMEVANGISVGATISNASPGGTGHRWEIVFDEATAILYNPTLDYMAGFRLILRSRNGEEKLICAPASPVGEDSRLLPFRRLAKRFLKALREKKPEMPDFTVGARVQRLMEAVHSSSKNGTILIV